MKQIIQHMNSGLTEIVDVPVPRIGEKSLLIKTRCSLISAGTERMLVGFGKASYLEKARQQPEKVKAVLEKISTDGLFTTFSAVQSKLEQPLPLGYCNVGIVKDIGSSVTGFAIGDRVISNGPHAEYVNVNRNLCARIPDTVEDEPASFTILASIGLQGIRLAMPTLGEAFVVTGSGLIGLLTIQLLIAQGCRVLAIDFDNAKLEIAKRYGADICNPNEQDPVAAGFEFSGGRGVDGVIVTASTQSTQPITDAARMSRKRGRIVLVGVAGLEINRADFYEKELTLQVSCSYGPGRYDQNYEVKGNDYPIGFVRWTEQRNFEAVLNLMAEGKIKTEELISRRYLFDDAAKAYDVLTSDKSSLAIILNYSVSNDQKLLSVVPLNNSNRYLQQNPVIGFIGAGNYSSRMLIPAFKNAGAQFHSIAASGGLSAVIHGRKFGFSEASTDFDRLIQDPAMNTLVIVTRHDSHANYVIKALEAGKNVYVEKPLSIDMDGLNRIMDIYNGLRAGQGTAPQLMVGFNRRFAPHVQTMKALLKPIVEPKTFIMTMNAGFLPKDHWTQDPLIGGGRIIGEACHYIDLMRFLADRSIVSVQVKAVKDKGLVTDDKAAITLGFDDGSFGTIFYLANGSQKFPKERIEVFTAGRILQLDNFLSLKGFGWPNFRKQALWRQDKGQNACAQAFLDSIKTGKPAIPPGEIFEVSRVTLEAAALLHVDG